MWQLYQNNYCSMTYNVVILVCQNLLNHSPNDKWKNGLPNLAIIGSTE